MHPSPKLGTEGHQLRLERIEATSRTFARGFESSKTRLLASDCLEKLLASKCSIAVRAFCSDITPSPALLRLPAGSPPHLDILIHEHPPASILCARARRAIGSERHEPGSK